MRKIIAFSFFSLLLAALLLSSAAANVISTFDNNLEGWIASPDNGLTYHSTGGNPGGYFTSRDYYAAWASVIAPAKFFGPWSTTGTVSADFKWEGTNPVATPPTTLIPAFLISDNNTSYAYTFSTQPTANWQTFAVAMNNSGWTRVTNNSLWYDVSPGAGWNPPLGTEALAQVLNNVQIFRIRLDSNGAYSTTLNLDATGVDNIRSPAVPLPASVLLLGSGLAGLAFYRRRRGGS